MNILRPLVLLLLIAFLTSDNLKAQSPTPVVVQAANSNAPATAVSSKPASTTEDQSMAATIKLLEQMKAANDEILAKQKAALERLDEVKEAADQLQIFAKRG
jgi:cell division GTPase FtsZ